MKKIRTCTNNTTLMILLVIGIVMVMGAYRIFSFLCEVTAFVWWLAPLGIAMAVLGIAGFLLARSAWKRLQYLRDHPEE